MPVLLQTERVIGLQQNIRDCRWESSKHPNLVARWRLVSNYVYAACVVFGWKRVSEHLGRPTRTRDAHGWEANPRKLQVDHSQHSKEALLDSTNSYWRLVRWVFDYGAHEGLPLAVWIPSSRHYDVRSKCWRGTLMESFSWPLGDGKGN